MQRSTDSSGSQGLLRHVDVRSATALVVANIIGAGVFTTTGFQAADLGHPGWILLLWVVGGLLAFCGAVCYAELGAQMPEAGGEYVYLRRAYGGVAGFMSAFVSLFAGFSAPIASAAKALVHYLAYYAPVLGDASGALPVGNVVALAIVWGLIAIQLRGAASGLRFTSAVTVLKVAGILLILLAAAALGEGDLGHFSHVSAVHAELGPADRSAAFATSLIFVMFCYSGWNASAYLAGEFRDPQRDLPRSLMYGTGFVILLYLGLNLFYFYGADVDTLAGKVEVGLISSRELFGEAGAGAVTLVLCVSLLASASAMTIAGPRVYYALGRDYPLLGFLARDDGRGTPVTALLLQGTITSVILLLGTVDQIIQYAGFTLTLFASLAVLSVIVLRFREPDLERPFRTWGYPVTPLLFLGVSLWMMFWAIQGRPTESLMALATVAAGGALFWFTTRREA